MGCRWRGIVCSAFFASFLARQKKNTQYLNHLICGFISKTSLMSYFIKKIIYESKLKFPA